jgi:hypothetical protein
VPATRTAAAEAATAIPPPQWCGLPSLTGVCPDESSHIVLRHCKRATSVSAIKATREFKYAQLSSWWGAGWMPQAPDPSDRSLSKRSWERAMQGWRNTLKKLYLIEG